MRQHCETSPPSSEWAACCRAGRCSSGGPLRETPVRLADVHVLAKPTTLHENAIVHEEGGAPDQR